MLPDYHNKEIMDIEKLSNEVELVEQDSMPCMQIRATLALAEQVERIADLLESILTTDVIGDIPSSEDVLVDMTMNLSEVQATLDAAAQAMATQPTGHWPGWICHLLESLDEALSKQDHQQVLDCRYAQRWVLNDVMQSIKARLETGGW